MPLVIDPNAIVIGAANVYNRALGSVAAWSSVGATSGDTIVRVRQAFYRPHLNGMLGNIEQLDVLTEQMAEVEFTMNEVASAKLALAVPGATSSVASNADASAGTPFSSTLAAAAAIGDTNIKVVAVTNLVAGDWIRIDVAGVLASYRQIDVVGTVGAGGTGISFRDPLKKAHASGVVAVEAVGDGKTVITGSTIRRQPSSSYNQWAVVGEAPTGYYEMLFDSGISDTAVAEIAFGDQTTGGVKTTIQSRYNGATANTPPWRLRIP